MFQAQHDFHDNCTILGITYQILFSKPYIYMKIHSVILNGSSNDCTRKNGQ